MTHHHQYESDYLIPALSLENGRKAHRLGLSYGGAHLAGTLTLDINACSLSPFGEPALCTKIAVAPIEVKLVQLQQDQHHTLYSIDNAGDGSKLGLHLVVRRGEGGRCPAKLIVLDTGGTVTQMVHLYHP